MQLDSGQGLKRRLTDWRKRRRTTRDERREPQLAYPRVRQSSALARQTDIEGKWGRRW
jgi:hypothetical protein